MLSKIEQNVLDKAYSSNKAYDDLVTLCDRYGGRFAGSEENREAAEYILGLYVDNGFRNPHLESFTFKGCTVGASSLEIKGANRLEVQTLPLPMTQSGSVEGELVPIETVEDLRDAGVKGKVVLGTNRLPLRQAVASGAAGFVWMHPYPMMGSPTGAVPSLVPSVSIRHEDGLMLKRMIGRGKLDVKLEAECKIYERASWNVCGEVKGSGDAGYVLLGGHFDGHEIAQAAFDCGAACTSITEMGRILNEERHRLKGDVRVVCFSAEEFGFWGSTDYAKVHADEMKDMRFTYQLDCNGGHEPQMVTTDYWPELEPFYNTLRDDLGLPMRYSQRMGPGDSRAFHALGIPTGSINDYRDPGRMPLLRTVRHTEYDTVDKISPRSLQDDVAIGAISTMRILASDDWPKHRSTEEVKTLAESLAS